MRMKIIEMRNTTHLKEGDVLGRDTYRDHSLVLKEGTKLTKHHINRLKAFGIDAVQIYFTIAPKSNEDLQKEEATEEKQAKKEFFNCLKKLKVERRYGRSFNSDLTYSSIESLFVKLLKNQNTNSLLSQLKNHDYHTYLHSVDVFILGSLTGKHLHYDHLEEFALGCLLHDVGKLCVPSNILSKPSSLTDEERKIIQRHPFDGSLLLSDYSPLVRNLAKAHHEKLDGSGYPNKLTGDYIPPEVQMLTILDIYSALTSTRPYRKSFSVPMALEMLARDTHAINEHHLIELCTLLEIYPLYSTVQLSSGEKAMVVDVNDKIPSFPVMLDTTEIRIHSLPMDQTIWIDRIVKLAD